ncbi:MAG: bifunctional oligoribonuclease/PAP phosphatase NrnA [Leptospiraceae bacterium]|nr:bifunctional oligoribonuclease/PAP phosphatase NrnA [Leptospiraceae bacterium]MCK6382626.1 bifunctional oligoribonuclease/PAP phosphatase NrnA [Leptospiraceae bacterium]NUM41887.1 bifunctional oligoribonuclease/PAP phosphatase NrnA [Leptospiraceae bacterium]
MSDKQKFELLFQKLSSFNDFLLTTHSNSDPDGIGSEIGLYYLLTKLGKSVRILNPDKTPEKYTFMDPQCRITYIDPDRMTNFYDSSTVVILDNSDLKRIGEVQNFIKKDLSNLIAIDHHDEVDYYSGLFLFSDIGSTAEIVCELFEIAGIEPDYTSALALYLGIVMDTGQFKYSKTRPRTYEIASKLVRHNFPVEEILRKLYEDYPYERLFLKRDIYQTLSVEPENGLASVVVTHEVLKKYKNSNGLGEGIANELLGPKEIFIAVMFTELPDSKVKISFRSKGNYNVCNVAKEFLGGGHANAAGAVVNGDLSKTKKEILSKLRDLYKHTTLE